MAHFSFQHSIDSVCFFSFLFLLPDAGYLLLPRHFSFFCTESLAWFLPLFRPLFSSSCIPKILCTVFPLFSPSSVFARFLHTRLVCAEYAATAGGCQRGIRYSVCVFRTHTKLVRRTGNFETERKRRIFLPSKVIFEIWRFYNG